MPYINFLFPICLFSTLLLLCSACKNINATIQSDEYNTSSVKKQSDTENGNNDESQNGLSKEKEKKTPIANSNDDELQQALPSKVSNPWTSNCCFADAVLKILTESGAIGEDIHESKNEICRLIATFIDLNRSGKPFPKEKMQELLRLYETYSLSYKFGQQGDYFCFFCEILNILFTECKSFKENFESSYEISCGCPSNITQISNEGSVNFNGECVDCKKKISRRALNRPPFIAVDSSKNLREQEFENIEVQHQDETMLHYELKSFLVYSGNGDSGHYWAYAKLSDGNYWKYDTLSTAVNSTSRGDAYQEFKNNFIAIYKRRD